MGGITVDRIVQDPSLRALAYRVMDETIAIANADLLHHGCAEEELLGEETVSCRERNGVRCRAYSSGLPYSQLLCASEGRNDDALR